MQVIGLCRFSYPACGGFQVEHESIDARRAYLYAAPRIEERFRLFETFTLPSLRGQTDGEFTFLILIDHAFPTLYLTRLRDLTSEMPQVQIVTRPPGPHRAVCQEVINSARVHGQPCLQFRHDDDDALAVSFIARLHAAAKDLEALRAAHPLVGIDFNRGFVARADGLGIAAEETVRPFWGVALAMAVQAQASLSIMNFSHNRLNRFMPTVSFTDAPMYVRGHNDHNDSRQNAHVTPVNLPRLDAAGEAMFLETFNISTDHIRARFART